MPLYDYKCSCGHTFEQLHKIDDRDNGVCPDCGETCKSSISPVSFKLPFTDPSGFPTAYDAWDKKRKQKIKQELKAGAGDS